MAFIVRFATKVRNNWKKSVFAVCAVSYGGSYVKEKYDIHQLMRACCKEAVEYGNVTTPITTPLQKVTVIINPAANRRASEETFAKYCEPILFLSGLAIEIVKTDSEGHARRYIEGLQQLPDALIIAGGDGTLSEAITGLFRRNASEVCPVAIVPVGRTNSVAHKMFSGSTSSNLEEAIGITNAAMAIVRGKVENKDVMKIEIIPSAADADEAPLKPVYAVGSLQWGAFRDILAKRDKYWYTNGLRQYSAFLFNSFSDEPTWACKATITYTDPCGGCKNCYDAHHSAATKAQSQRWWSKFLPKFQLGVAAHGKDFSKVTNEQCAKQTQTHVSPSEILVLTENIESRSEVPSLHVKFGKDDYYGFNFMRESWSRLDHPNQMDTDHVLTVRTIDIIPDVVERPILSENEEASATENGETGPEVFYSIDNEAYEVKPVRISLMPQAVPMYIL